MLRIFIDTSALVALTVSTEEYHLQCKRAYENYNKENALYFTNFFVVSEFYTRLLTSFGKYYLEKAILIMNDLKTEGNIRIFNISPSVFSEAETFMIKFSEHKLSFTDASIYSTVKQYKLDEVFTLDSGFKKVGLKTSF